MRRCIPVRSMLHQVDPSVPFEDQIGELKKLQEEGKIGASGSTR
ncbi:hypothetical protein [Streptomyces sp. NPDC056660]